MSLMVVEWDLMVGSMGFNGESSYCMVISWVSSFHGDFFMKFDGHEWGLV